MRVDGRRHWQAAMLATSAVRRHTPGTMSTTDAIAAGGAPEPAHATAELPQELLRQLRDGLPLPAGALRGFVQGIAAGGVGDDAEPEAGTGEVAVLSASRIVCVRR